MSGCIKDDIKTIIVGLFAEFEMISRYKYLTGTKSRVAQ